MALCRGCAAAATAHLVFALVHHGLQIMSREYARLGETILRWIARRYVNEKAKQQIKALHTVTADN